MSTEDELVTLKAQMQAALNRINDVEERIGSHIGLDGGSATLLSPHPSIGFSTALVEMTPPQITASQNNYSPAGLVADTMLRLATDAARDITGVVLASSTNVPAAMLIIHNIGSFVITLKDESASSIAANRFAFSGDMNLAADDCCVLQYDGTSNRWRAPARTGLGLSTSTPLTDGTAAVGTEPFASHGDHVHPGGSGSMLGVNILRKTLDPTTWSVGVNNLATIAGGAVRIDAWAYRVTITCGSGGAATVSIGNAVTANRYAAVTAVAGMTAGMQLLAATPVAEVAANWAFVIQNSVGSANITATVAGAVFNAGSIEMVVVWSPLTSGATLT